MADFSFSVTGNSLLRYMAVSGAFKDFFTDREPDFYVDSCLDEAEVLQSASYRERKVFSVYRYAEKAAESASRSPARWKGQSRSMRATCSIST